MRKSIITTITIAAALTFGLAGCSTGGSLDYDLPSEQEIEQPVEPTVEEPAVEEPAAPEFTLAQQNAIGSAESYLRFMGFSRTGLIEQLVYEGFSPEDAAFAADNAGADWNQEAAESATSYLNTMSFSRQGLYDQLAYEGFLPAEIEFGLAAVGY